MVHGIEDGKKPSELSDKELIFLWREMGRNRGVHDRLFALEEGALPEVGNAFEEQYVAIYEELKSRNLQ